MEINCYVERLYLLIGNSNCILMNIAYQNSRLMSCLNFGQNLRFNL